MRLRPDLEHVIGQRPLLFERHFRRCSVPGLVLLWCGEDHRHGLGMDWPNDAVRLRGQERIEQVLVLDRLGLGDAHSRSWPPDTRERRQGPLLVEREPDLRLARLGVLVLRYMGRQVLQLPGSSLGVRSPHQAQIAP
jgi:hypothetical protein